MAAYDKNGFQIRKGKMVQYQGLNWEVVAIRGDNLKLVRHDGNFVRHEKNNVYCRDTIVW